MTTSDELIELMVTANYGQADARVQHLFRESLHVLVGLAKIEERREVNIDMSSDAGHAYRVTMH